MDELFKEVVNWMAGEGLCICMVSEEEITGEAAIIPGGIGQYILRYTRMLAGQGHDVTILCQSKKPFDFRKEGIRHIGLPRRGKIPWDVTVYFWLLTRRYDIVEFPEWGGIGALPAMLLPKTRGKVVTRGHGHSMFVQRVHGLPVKKGKQHIKEWLQVRCSQGILANSEYLREEFCRDFGLDASKIDVCHIGIDAGAVGGSPPFRNTYKGPVLIYVGGMDRRKGPADLLRILHHLNQKQRDCEAKLIMIGQDTPTGPCQSSYLKYCIQLAKELGVLEQVEFVPATPRSQLHRYYQEASVFVSATRAETLGIPFLEAMSMGLPVVTWKAGAAPELIRHGEDGLLYERDDFDGFADGLLSLIGDIELWNRMSSRAMENVNSRFLEKDILERQVTWYRKISV